MAIIENAKTKPQAFNCPSCGGLIEIKAHGTTVSIFCKYCGSEIDALDKNYSLIKEAKRKTLKTYLKIGQLGIFDGIKWEVIGFMIKRDTEGYEWEEYLLYNPYEGFRFLVQFNGHWNLVEVVKSGVFNIDIKRSYISYQDQNFKIFYYGAATVVAVGGEFYWRVKFGDAIEIFDYIANKYVLSVERDSSEINVSLGEYKTKSQIAEAFNLNLSKLPYVKGLAPNQPFKYDDKILPTVVIGTIFTILLILLQWLFFGMDEKSFILKRNINVTNKTSAIIGNLTLPKDDFLEILTVCQLNNNWAEINYTIIDEKTQKVVIAANQGCEYYSGIDTYDGSYWSEGSTSSEVRLHKIPAGNYILMAEANFEKMDSLGMYVIIYGNSVPADNLYLALLLVLALPIFLIIFKIWFNSLKNQNANVECLIGGHYRLDLES